jgi:uncharacterized protein YndB with AHSA1/START domain
MPKVSRSKVIEADPDAVWELVADPHHMPRWWPLAVRVEDVREGSAPGNLEWTVVLRTEGGTQVRADYSGEAQAGERRFFWEQRVAGTPFERIMKAARVEVGVEAAAGAGEASSVTIRSEESLRGLSRLGGAMIRSAARRRLDEALDGLQRALVGEPST